MLKIIQISDCHLFSHAKAKHFDALVYPQLVNVLNDIYTTEQADFIIFTGDLTQDHTAESYQLFNQVFAQSKSTTPVYYLAGNHDEPQMLDDYLNHHVFKKAKSIESEYWQIQLLNSKSNTPSGHLCQQELSRISDLNDDKFQFLLMHHHPVDVGYFIDRHGLENKQALWSAMANKAQIKAISCGHVHRAMELEKPVSHRHDIKLFTCPATSITFAKQSETLIPEYNQIGYRSFILHDDGKITSCVRTIEAIKNQ